MHFLARLFFLFLLLVFLAFAWSNKQAVVLQFWPFDFQIETPLYAALLACIGLGLLIGSLFTWFSMIGMRFRVRALQKALDAEKARGVDAGPSRKWWRRFHV